MKTYKPRICTICGKEYTPTATRQKTCSKNCANKARQIRREEKACEKAPPVCVVCGKEFVPTYNHQITCGEECRRERQRYYNRKNYRKTHDVKKTAVCWICGKEFESSHKSAKYCSDECRKEAVRRNAINRYHRVKQEEEEKRPKATCPICGKVFPLTCYNKKFCSASCRKKYERRALSEHRKAEREAQKMFAAMLEERAESVSAETFDRMEFFEKAPVREDVPLTPQQIERLQGVSGVSYGKLMQMQYFGTLYQFCKERGITEL